MWPCYKYTLKNAYLRKSTLVFLILSISILSLAPILTDYSKFSTPDQLFEAGGSTFFIIYWFVVVAGFLAFFIGSRSTSFVADELEDGTFLTVISKPIDRWQIVLGKYLAIATANLLFIIAITMFPLLMAANKMGHAQVSMLLIGAGLKTVLFSTFYMLIILSITLPLSIRLAAKVVTIISIGVGVVVMLGSLVLPIILSISGFQWRNSMKVGNIINSETKASYDAKHNSYKMISLIDVPQHFKSMFSYATNGLAEKSLMGSLLSSPVKVTFEEIKNTVDGKEVISYKITKAEDFINPIMLYMIYGTISLGLGALTIKSFTKKDFM